MPRLHIAGRRLRTARADFFFAVFPSPWSIADTVSDEKLSGAGDSVLPERCRAEDRVLMTLDLDFANVQAYPPKSHPGIVVFPSKSQDKPTLVALLKRLVPALLQFSPKHQLWIVEPDRIRYREE